MNGNKYTTTITPGNPNRFDLIEFGDRGSDDVRAAAGSARQRRDHATGAFPMISSFTANSFATIDKPRPSCRAAFRNSKQRTGTLAGRSGETARF